MVGEPRTELERRRKRLLYNEEEGATSGRRDGGKGDGVKREGGEEAEEDEDEDEDEGMGGGRGGRVKRWAGRMVGVAVIVCEWVVVVRIHGKMVGGRKLLKMFLPEVPFEGVVEGLVAWAVGGGGV